jgi:exonuclease SbcC
LDEFNTQLHQEEVVGLHLALVEKQKLIADKEQLIRSLEADSDSLGLKFADKMEGSQFTGLDEIKQILAMISDQPGLIEQKAKLDADVAQLGAELEKFYSELENRGGQNKPELSIEEIDLQLINIREKKELADLEAQRLERIISEQQQFKDKHTVLLVQLDNQQALVKQAKSEVIELTEENGMKFRRRVQERVVERLLSQTNNTLEKISGRYYLRQQPSDRGLALEIEDTFQGNVRRLPKTLSGGESFIVSLALALALSELANSGRSVDSLFLDEGFGNLDAESLYTVINTLEGLHAHGKTVGVISHVEAVQKRFKVQLQLVKKPNGLGELRKVS